MSLKSLAATLIRASPGLSYMFLTLFWIYLTLGHRVRKTRNAFEMQLIAQGMKKQDAERLSACYKALQDDIVNTVKQSLRGVRRTSP